MKKTFVLGLFVLLACSALVFLLSCGGGGGGGGGGGPVDIDADGFDSSVDCDDEASSCTDDCASDVDADGIPDCRDLCLDTDLDGYGTDNSAAIIGSGAASVGECASDGTTPCDGGGSSCLDTDCDDDPASGSSINPGAIEVCGDGTDNNCDNLLDCNDSAACGSDLACSGCLDADGDGYFAIASSCSGGDDCDDGDNSINPGGLGLFDCPMLLCSSCDGDDDCGPGGQCVSFEGPNVCTTDCSDSSPNGQGVCPSGFTCEDRANGYGYQCYPNSSSCTCLPGDDGDIRPCARTNSYGTCSGIETCDQATGWYGCTAATPAAETCDGIDNDCDGTVDEGDPGGGGACDGSDGDLCTEGTSSCVSGVLVCSDGTGTSIELCNGTDDDCDGSTDEGFPDLGAGCLIGVGECATSGIKACSGSGMGTTCVGTPLPPTTEICDDKDNDCDGTVDEGVKTTWYPDADNDTYTVTSGTVLACTDPDGSGIGYVATPSAQTDCNDGSASVNPGATDVPGNSLDENCSGYVACYTDADNDTYGSGSSGESSHTATGGISVTPGACGSSNSDNWDDTNNDCNDASAAANPGATDVPGNDMDENCSGSVVCYNDADSDGYGASTSGESSFIATGGVAQTTGACGSSTADLWDDTGDDCNDADAAIHPSIIELCDGLDNNCNGFIDEGGSMVCSGYQCEAGACLTSCADKSDCAYARYCVGGTCVPTYSDGTPCAYSDQCTSNFCVDGYCCNHACESTCTSCNNAAYLGVCSSDPVGSNDAGCVSPDYCSYGTCVDVP